MVYIMIFEVDGACRGNGWPGSRAAAAAVQVKRSGKRSCWTKTLPAYPTPTNQRAELTAIIMALELALEYFNDNLNPQTYIDVTIKSDSRYAVNCMNEWMYKWCNNGWINSAGNNVANTDLLQEALHLENRLTDEGKVHYEWIPRGENQHADQLCNEELDGADEADDSDDDMYW